jgi:hypothetical protein
MYECQVVIRNISGYRNMMTSTMRHRSIGGLVLRSHIKIRPMSVPQWQAQRRFSFNSVLRKPFHCLPRGITRTTLRGSFQDIYS